MTVGCHRGGRGGMYTHGLGSQVLENAGHKICGCPIPLAVLCVQCDIGHWL